MFFETLEPRLCLSHAAPHHARERGAPHHVHHPAYTAPVVVAPTLTNFRSTLILDANHYGVQLQWSESDPTVVSYQIERSADGGATWEMIAQPGNGQDFYFDFPAPDGTTLTYQIAEVR